MEPDDGLYGSPNIATPSDEPLQFYVTLTNLAVGTYSYKLTARDASGKVIVTSASRMSTIR